MDKPLATALQGKPHLAVFDDIARTRLEAINLDVLLFGMIDTAPAAALPILAEQYHILGVEGWNMAVTEADKRALLKRALDLHRRKGTPWAIKEAIKGMGFPDVTISEGISRYHNGAITYNGTETHGSEGWAKFKVIVTAGAVPHPAAIEAQVAALIEEYKSARSTLVSLTFI